MQRPQMVADIGAASSAALAASTWIANLNEVLQLAATVVAICAGAAAAWWHWEKALHARRERLAGKRPPNA